MRAYAERPTPAVPPRAALAVAPAGARSPAAPRGLPHRLASMPSDPPIQLAPDPASKEAAIAQHTVDQDRVYAMIDNAAAAVVPASDKASRAKLLKNTAELIRGGFESIIVMSRTHVTPTLRGENEIAFFDLGVRYPNRGGDYNDARDAHIYMRPGNIQGHADHRGEIRMYDPSDVSDENLKTVLIHETQHQADFHNPNEAYAQPALDAAGTAQAVNGYQTEFRAYWVGGIFRDIKHLGTSIDTLGFSTFEAANTRRVPSGSLLVPNFTTAFANQRQEKIFWHMIDSGSYGYILTAYQGSPAFRAMVDAFTLPVGGNLLNSIRIDTMRQQVNTLGFRMKQYRDFLIAPLADEGLRAPGLLTRQQQIDAATLQLQTQRALLDREDLEFLADQTASAPFWEFAETKLGAGPKDVLYQYIAGRRTALRHADLLARLAAPTFVTHGAAAPLAGAGH
jgi:hypothetical protein